MIAVISYDYCDFCENHGQVCNGVTVLTLGIMYICGINPLDVSIAQRHDGGDKVLVCGTQLCIAQVEHAYDENTGEQHPIYHFLDAQGARKVQQVSASDLQTALPQCLPMVHLQDTSANRWCPRMRLLPEWVTSLSMAGLLLAKVGLQPRPQVVTRAGLDLWLRNTDATAKSILLQQVRDGACSAPSNHLCHTVLVPLCAPLPASPAGTVLSWEGGRRWRRLRDLPPSPEAGHCLVLLPCTMLLKEVCTPRNRVIRRQVLNFLLAHGVVSRQQLLRARRELQGRHWIAFVARLLIAHREVATAHFSVEEGKCSATAAC